MADEKLTDLTQVGTPASNDVLYLVDVSDTTDDPAGSSRSCLVSQISALAAVNLTGPITSVGNATSIASQTGTGTKFVVDTSPTLVTPTLGVATVTSVNGNTITSGTGTLTLSTFTLTVGATASISGTHSGTSSGTNTGDQTITLTGDVTGSGTGSFATTMATVNANVGSFINAGITVDGKGRITAASNGSVIPSAANPTATVGLSATNGSAANFMRSDGGPALDVTISPTWSNPHIFSVAGAASVPAIKVSGTPFAGTGTTSFPQLYLNDATATASTTLATAGTFLGINIHGSQNFCDFMKDGASKFKMDSGGNITMAGSAVINNTSGSIGILSSGGAGSGCAVGGTGTNRIGNAFFTHINSGEHVRLTADATNATTTFSNLTDLTVTLVAGAKHTGRLVIKCNESVAAEGIKLDFNGGAATMTSFWAAAAVLVGGTVVAGTQISTSLAGVMNFTTITGETVIVVEISLVVNAGGTIIPRFAQDSHTTGTVTAELGSFLWIPTSSN